ncbi:negative regulator of flagellin synthesis FlgM [Chitinivorax tropicus]|uniref:Negative regulator of flagellin synthesis n=1 Tax=Chitinivorax tropicus TaxID=714531 RepID=A0A840MJ59_9PROT|nr:flagellar biosynthesis anti-sigma factor FlgM [Chitinivorax tropicus]MBB5017545.1 negative regulator of flagellin synthesis FlgM [Chitinivorax tropicus]
MKVDNSGKPITPSGVKPGTTRLPAKADATETSGKPRTDNVELTSTSLRMQALEGALNKQPTVDSARVAEIRQAISEGRFKINADVIADKLVASVKELLAKRED